MKHSHELVEAGSPPLTIRLPRTGTPCPHTGLSRTALNKLILPCPENDFLPPVRSVVLKAPGGVKGIRLIYYSSLRDFLETQGKRQPVCTSDERGASQ